MTTVLVITVAIDLLLAVGVGMIMASFLFMHRMTQMQINSIRTITGTQDTQHLSREEADIIEQAAGKIMVFQLSGPMSFSSAKSVVRRHAAMAGYEIMLLDLTEVTTVDFTTSRALEDILLDCTNAGHRVFLVGARETVLKMLEKQGVTRIFKPGKIHQDRLVALQHAQKLLIEQTESE